MVNFNLHLTQSIYWSEQNRIGLLKVIQRSFTVLIVTSYQMNPLQKGLCHIKTDCLLKSFWNLTLLPNAQDLLAEEKPRLICGLGLPGTRFTVVAMILYIFHCLGVSLKIYHFYFLFIGIYHLCKFCQRLNAKCSMQPIKNVNFRLAFMLIEDPMLDL